jgi:hypothetical protein
MKNILSVFVIDPNKDQHDYSLVSIDTDEEYKYLYGERKFDFYVVKNTDNLMSELNKAKGFDCLITVGEDINFSALNDLSFEFRKKWIHKDDFQPETLARSIINVFLGNIGRERPQEVKLFSIFTCTFNTPKKTFMRLYESLCNQTYKNWNWYILDDSTAPSTADMIEHIHDPRIVVFRNITNHGNIGFNKHMIASACDGDYLVEVDHDDYLTPDCLELLNKAFEKYPDSDFIYSHAMEFVNGREVYYDENFAYGLGEYRDMNVLGQMRHIALTADVNAISVRGIHALPNHVRCWEKNFYHKIGGHNIELSVLDDMDILIRTFLFGTMTKVDKVLYIQDEGNAESRRTGSTAQSKRFDEIQRTNGLLRKKYDLQIHNRLIELDSDDPIWLEEYQCSNLNKGYDKSKLKILNHTYIPE